MGMMDQPVPEILVRLGAAPSFGVRSRLDCRTCHLPHGTAAQMTGITDGAGLPGETSATDSALLRLDNRGVCEVCHQK